MCINHPKILTSQKLRSPLYLFLLKRFPRYPYKKPHKTWKTVKALKKHQNVLTATHKKREILFQRFVGEYTLLPPILFLKGENENWVNWENWVGRETIVLKNPRGKSGRERENR